MRCNQCTITVTSYCARWLLKSSASRLLTQTFIQAQIKENIKAPRHWPLCGEFTVDRWIPRTNAINAEIVSIRWRHDGHLPTPSSPIWYHSEYSTSLLYKTPRSKPALNKLFQFAIHTFVLKWNILFILVSEMTYIYNTSGDITLSVTISQSVYNLGMLWHLLNWSIGGQGSMNPFGLTRSTSFTLYDNW